MKWLVLVLLYATALSIGLARRGIRSSISGASPVAERNPIRVLIVGATGGTGRQLVGQALERGYVVTGARSRSVTRVDVADFMLNQMTDNTYLNAAPGVCW